MEKFEIIITTLFGLESLVAQEKYVVLAMKQLQLRTAELRLWVYEAVCRANMWIRTGERVLIKTAEFTAVTFDELFEKTKTVDWSKWIGKMTLFL